MTKKKFYNHVYVVWFFTSIDDRFPGDCRLGALIVDKPNVDVQKQLNVLLNVMGFRNKQDYRNAYPGQFTEGSENVMRIDRKFGWSDCWIMGNINTQSYSYNEGYYPVHTLKTTLRNEAEDLELIFTPTIKEVDSCKYYNRASHTTHWFCSDWKEDG